MKHSNFIPPTLFIFIITLFPLILAQQNYTRQECGSSDDQAAVLGYTCNGISQTCQAYLTFRAASPYDSVTAISTLLSVNPSQLARLNSVQETAVFDTNRVVLVPVTCSCSGMYYQTNTTYSVRQDNTFQGIANDVFQGLSTCQAIQAQSTISTTNLFAGNRLTVPLRCACPTRSQNESGVNYLLSYLVAEGQFVSSISVQFHADTGATLEANGLSEQAATIYPSSTLLVPLQDPPSSSQATVPQPPPPPFMPPPFVPSPGGGSSNTWIYAVVGVIGGLVLVSVIGVVVFCVFCGKKRKKAESVVSTEKFESVEKALYKKEEDEESQDFLDSLSSIAQSLKVYTFKELRDSTEDFSAGFLIKGSVFRATINGDLAAIKKMNGDVSKEINLLNKINHFNLIRLSGVCFNEGNWYLVYEYASNGQLGDWIHQASEAKILNWTQRLHIALF